MISSPTYEQARNDETQRQTFLDRFFQRHPNSNVSSLIYNIHKKPGLDRVTELQFAGEMGDEEADRMRKVVYESTQYAFLLITPDMIGKGDRHPIFVNPRAFNELSEADFEYNIVDHEYMHTHDFRFGIPLPNGVVINHTNADQLQPVTLEAILEIRASTHQLMRGVQKRIQHSYGFKNAIACFLQYYSQLRNIRPKNDFEREVIIQIQNDSYQRIVPHVI